MPKCCPTRTQTQCLAKFAGLMLPATPATPAEFEVTLLLPPFGPCADLANVCLTGRDGQCQIAITDKQVSCVDAADRCSLTPHNFARSVTPHRPGLLTLLPSSHTQYALCPAYLASLA